MGNALNQSMGFCGLSKLRCADALLHQAGMRECGVPTEPEGALRRDAVERTPVFGREGVLIHGPRHARAVLHDPVAVVPR